MQKGCELSSDECDGGRGTGRGAASRGGRANVYSGLNYSAQETERVKAVDERQATSTKPVIPKISIVKFISQNSNKNKLSKTLASPNPYMQDNNNEFHGPDEFDYSEVVSSLQEKLSSNYEMIHATLQDENENLKAQNLYLLSYVRRIKVKYKDLGRQLRQLQEKNAEICREKEVLEDFIRTGKNKKLSSPYL